MGWGGDLKALTVHDLVLRPTPARTESATFKIGAASNGVLINAGSTRRGRRGRQAHHRRSHLTPHQPLPIPPPFSSRRPKIHPRSAVRAYMPVRLWREHAGGETRLQEPVDELEAEEERLGPQLELEVHLPRPQSPHSTKSELNSAARLRQRERTR